MAFYLTIVVHLSKYNLKRIHVCLVLQRAGLCDNVFKIFIGFHYNLHLNGTN
jgi:hypothetical protein